MNSLQKNKITAPTVRYDSSLEQYNKTVLFPKKLALANEMLAKYGLPKEVQSLPEALKVPNTQS